MPLEKEPDLPDLAPAGLALLIVFGLLMWYDRPIESSRPFDLYAQHQYRAIGYAFENWLWQDPFDPVDNPFPFDPIFQKKKEGQCENQLKERVKKNSVRILAPLLKVRPNTMENKELRTRHRYSVIAGLIESGYRPSEPHRLHFCSSRITSDTKSRDNETSDKATSNKEIGDKYDVRWEHYYHKSQGNSGEKKPDILVLWMDSEIFKTDEDKKAAYDKKFAFVPENLLPPTKEDKRNLHVFDLNNVFDQDFSRKITEKHKNIEFIQSVETDGSALTEKLTKELELQNVREPSGVILVTEQDSENMRGAARSFRESFCHSLRNKAVIPEPATCEIKNVFYLKGLDAYPQTIQKQDKNGDYQAASKWADRLSVIDLDNSLPPAVGPSQSDYINRLAEQIKDTHKEINLEKRDSGIKAVVIFGSDFYDKLLILEALRAAMPNILVFTTGLDAAMFHPQYWSSTRNLVAVSHFNLLLNEEYQKQFPAFRDSSQTHIFYRTIKIAKDGVGKSEVISPQIFEIGRNGPVRLSRLGEKKRRLKISSFRRYIEASQKTVDATGGNCIFSYLASLEDTP